MGFIGYRRSQATGQLPGKNWENPYGKSNTQIWRLEGGCRGSPPSPLISRFVYRIFYMNFPKICPVAIQQPVFFLRSLYDHSPRATHSPTPPRGSQDCQQPSFCFLRFPYAPIDVVVTFFVVKIFCYFRHDSLPRHAILTKLGGNRPFSLPDLSKPKTLEIKRQETHKNKNQHVRK